MNKLLILGVSTVLLAGCIGQKTAKPEATPTQTEDQAAGEFAKVSAAMQAGQSVKCTMTKTDSTATMTYLLKGKKVKITGLAAEGAAAADSSTMLSDTEYMYTWSDAKKEGMKFKLPTEAELKETSESMAQQVPDFSNTADQQKYEDMGYVVKCDVTNVPDSEFVPPTDVNFVDTSAMMESAKKMQPANGESMSPEQEEALKKQAEEMMKQYQQ